MRTHAEVHEEVARILHGTRLQTFMVTTNSFQDEDGTVAIEWACTISSGRKAEFFFRSRLPGELVDEVRKGVDRRRAFFTIRDLESLRGAPPKDTALADPNPSRADEPPKVAPADESKTAGQYHPTGEF